MHLLYLTFGNHLQNHQQAALSIYSFLQQPGKIDSINIMTDAPSFYNHFSGYVNIIQLDAATLKEWKGPYDFFWRVKIKALEQICRHNAGEPVMYLDTDTFLYDDAVHITGMLSKGQAVMHENEGAITTLPDKTVKRMWRHIAQKQYGGLRMQASDCMWNAGVVATPNTQDGKECRLALQICDEMCADGVPVRLIEQYALALSLQNTYTLQPAKAFIAHYWSNKEEWDEYIQQWLTELQLKQLNIHERIAAFKALDLKKLPVLKKKRSWAIRLHKWVDSAFVPKNISYISR